MLISRFARICCLVVSLLVLLGTFVGCLYPMEQTPETENTEFKETTPATTTTQAAENENSNVIKVGFVTGVKLRVRSGPGANYEKIGELDTGTKVSFTEFQEASDGAWGKMEQGWIFMDHVYIPGTVTQRHGYVVVKKNNVSIYDAILQPRNEVKKLSIGDRYEILHYITFEGSERWAYTRQGWLDMRNVYLEGEDGENPKTGIVQDTTPLNVRTGPGTNYEIIDKLENGTRVSVKEQITCNYDTWGYNGTGWIAMSRVVDDNNPHLHTDEPVDIWVHVTSGATSEYGGACEYGGIIALYSDGCFVHSCFGYQPESPTSQKYVPIISGPYGEFCPVYYGTYILKDNSLQLIYNCWAEAGLDDVSYVPISYNITISGNFASDNLQIDIANPGDIPSGWGTPDGGSPTTLSTTQPKLYRFVPTAGQSFTGEIVRSFAPEIIGIDMLY